MMGSMPEDDAFLEKLTPVIGGVCGVAAIVLGGSRARGTATPTSDYDLGVYFSRTNPLDVEGLRRALRPVVDAPDSAVVTEVGEWGPWIVGGGWLHVGGRKVDILYREIEAVDAAIADAREGRVTMHYQPGHPHGFCSAHWMGEVALARILHDPDGAMAALKAKTSPYPAALQRALIGRFMWEVLFSIQNAELAAVRGEQTHVAGCAYRALCCLAQVLFALNARYLINEKGALGEAAQFPLTVTGLTARVEAIWADIGRGAYERPLAELKWIDAEAKALVSDARTAGPA